MGAASGPVTFPLCTTNKPYIITNYINHVTGRFFNKTWWKQRTPLPWSNTKMQRLIWGEEEKETPELLIREFENLFKVVNKEKWVKEVKEKSARNNLNWPFISEE